MGKKKKIRRFRSFYKGPRVREVISACERGNFANMEYLMTYPGAVTEIALVLQIHITEAERRFVTWRDVYLGEVA